MLRSIWKLGGGDLAEILEIRKEAFGSDLADEFDSAAMHALMLDEETPVACGSIWHDGQRFYIGKIGVIDRERAQHVGDLLTRLLIYKTVQFASELFVKTPKEGEGYFARYGFSPVAGEEGVMSVKKEDVVFPSACHHSCGADLKPRENK